VSPPALRVSNEEAAMARTEHLPIYKGSYDLCLYLEQVVQGFSRYHKYTLGTDLRDGKKGNALTLGSR